MDDKVPSGGCEGISGSRSGILALHFALEHTPSQPRRRTNVTLPSLKRPRRRLIDNERGDAEERRFAQRQREELRKKRDEERRGVREECRWDWTVPCSLDNMQS